MPLAPFLLQGITRVSMPLGSMCMWFQEIIRQRLLLELISMGHKYRLHRARVGTKLVTQQQQMLTKNYFSFGKLYRNMEFNFRQTNIKEIFMKIVSYQPYPEYSGTKGVRVSRAATSQLLHYSIQRIL